MALHILRSHSLTISDDLSLSPTFAPSPPSSPPLLRMIWSRFGTSRGGLSPHAESATNLGSPPPRLPPREQSTTAPCGAAGQRECRRPRRPLLHQCTDLPRAQWIADCCSGSLTRRTWRVLMCQARPWPPLPFRPIPRPRRPRVVVALVRWDTVEGVAGPRRFAPCPLSKRPSRSSCMRTRYVGC